MRGHVVEGGEKDAAVENVEVEEALEFESAARRIRRRCAKVSKQRCIRRGHRGNTSRETGGSNMFGDAIGGSVWRAGYAFRTRRREDVLERGSHGG